MAARTGAIQSRRQIAGMTKARTNRNAKRAVARVRAAGGPHKGRGNHDNSEKVGKVGAKAGSLGKFVKAAQRAKERRVNAARGIGSRNAG